MIDFHPTLARGGRAAGASSAPRPPAETAPRRQGDAGPTFTLHLGGRLDLAELRRLRQLLLAERAAASLELDFSAVRGADGDALLLLESDLSRISAAGIPVSLRGISSRLHVQLYLHPIVRFAADAEELFTDPDLDWPGFRASRR